MAAISIQDLALLVEATMKGTLGAPRQAVAACAAASIRTAANILCGVSAPTDIEVEAKERLGPIEKVIKARVTAGTEGKRANLNGTVRRTRNHAEHNNFGQGPALWRTAGVLSAPPTKNTFIHFDVDSSGSHADESVHAFSAPDTPCGQSDATLTSTTQSSSLSAKTADACENFDIYDVGADKATQTDSEAKAITDDIAVQTEDPVVGDSFTDYDLGMCYDPGLDDDSYPRWTPPPEFVLGGPPWQPLHEGYFFLEVGDFLRKGLADCVVHGVDINILADAIEVIIKCFDTRRLLGDKGARIKGLQATFQRHYDRNVRVYAERV